MSQNTSFHHGIITHQILRAFLLSFLYEVFFISSLETDFNNYLMEHSFMDNKVMQFLIQSILDTEEYTLEGIAIYTHIPFDVIYDITCGINKQASITTWAKLVDLYLRTKPDILPMLINKLLEIRDKKNRESFLSILKKYNCN